jgi:hypothetical protein
MGIGIHVIRLVTAEQLSDFAVQDRVDSGAISSRGEGITHAFGAIGVGEPDRIEFKSAHLAVCAVGEHDGERNAIKTASYRGDIGHEVLLMHGRGASGRLPGLGGPRKPSRSFDASSGPNGTHIGARAGTTVSAPSGKV